MGNNTKISDVFVLHKLSSSLGNNPANIITLLILLIKKY
jgi:hypothetical protein